jgi:hypothetical protein
MDIKDRPLTSSQLNKIVEHIKQYHLFGYGGRHIKYIRPSIDLRINKCFHIVFEGIHKKEFDFRDSEESMFVRIMKWLQEKEDIVPPNKGGCWFCHRKTDDMVFDTEFDTYLHLDCLRKALEEDPDHPEAKVMSYLLEQN